MTGEDENYDGNHNSFITGRKWDDHEHRWWYTPAHVCRRWRNLILGSSSFLDLYLVCTHGTPVADLLSKSPPIPLIIDYLDIDRGYILSAEDEKGIFLALKQPDRIRCIRVGSDPLDSQKFAMVMDGELPILEHLVMASGMDDVAFVFPKIIQAPHLRHLVLDGVAPSIGSPLITTAMGLVTLCLVIHNSSSYFNSNTLLQWVSPLSQLETLEITVTCRMVMQPSHMPTITHTILPNLRLLSLQHREKPEGIKLLSK